MPRHAQGALVEYGIAAPPLALVFELNPQTLSYTRTSTVAVGAALGTRRGYDFASPRTAPGAALGVDAQAETVTFEILLDATDRLNAGDPAALQHGVQPELDVLAAMQEPRVQGANRFSALAGAAAGARAFQRVELPPVLLFVWGAHVLPVFLTSAQVQEQLHLPNLIPYRASATLTLQVTEANNPFYRAERARIVGSAALHAARLGAALRGILR